MGAIEPGTRATVLVLPPMSVLDFRVELDNHSVGKRLLIVAGTCTITP